MNHCLATISLFFLQDRFHGYVLSLDVEAINAKPKVKRMHVCIRREMMMHGERLEEKLAHRKGEQGDR